MRGYRFGTTAHYVRRYSCPVRKRWNGYCLHVQYDSIRHDSEKSYAKMTEKCMLTQPETIVGVKITVINPNQRYGRTQTVINGVWKKYKEQKCLAYNL